MTAAQCLAPRDIGPFMGDAAGPTALIVARPLSEVVVPESRPWPGSCT